ncbi:MAG: portal protein [Candidatus Bathyarchaeota archaeon]
MASSGKSAVEDCREFIDHVSEVESENRVRALEDLKFLAGDQWPAQIQQQRELEQRPCLTINKLPAFVRQVTNQMRQNRPQVKVHPVDNGADIEIAKILQGLERHIHVNSSADSAYDTAGEHCVTFGWGYWRVVTDYVREDSFDQDIFIRRIRNPFSVYFDPASQEPDGSDAERAAISDWISRDEFKRQYQDADINAYGYYGSGDFDPEWADDTMVRVAEYFRVERTRDTLVRLSNGAAVFKSQLETPQWQQYVAATGLQVIGDRPSTRRVVRWSKVNGKDQLETREWAGYWIPIVPCYGIEYDIEGKRRLQGIVRDAKDPQRMYNYWRTSETELVALAPKAPWVVAEGQIAGYEDIWRQANTRSFPTLPYKPTDLKGHPVPPPQRQPFAGAPTGIIQAALEASDDIKATTGLFDASLGAKGNETSGVAIRARQQQGDVANFHFFDNLVRSIRHTGRIVLDLIPKIYDTERVARIIGEDGTPSTVTLNEKQRDPQTGAIDRVLNDVTVGTYDVVIDTGPSYQTKRIEAAESMIEFIRAFPQAAGPLGPLIAKNMDWPGAEDIANVLKALLPPAVQAAIDGKEAQGVPPELQSKMQEMDQVIQQLQSALQDSQRKLEDKSGVEQIRAGKDIRIEQMRDQRERDLEAMRSDTRRDVEEIKGWIAMLIERMQPPPALQAEISESMNDQGAQDAYPIN